MGMRKSSIFGVFFLTQTKVWMTSTFIIHVGTSNSFGLLLFLVTFDLPLNEEIVEVIDWKVGKKVSCLGGMDKPKRFSFTAL